MPLQEPENPEENQPDKLQSLLVPSESAYFDAVTSGVSASPPDPIGFAGGLLHGVSLGFAGEPPNTGWGVAGDITGNIINFIALSKGAGMIAEGLGVSRGTTLGSQVQHELLTSLPADVAFMASPEGKDMENPERYLLGATVLNMSTPLMGRLYNLFKNKIKIPEKLTQEGGKITSEVLDEATTAFNDKQFHTGFLKALEEGDTSVLTPKGDIQKLKLPKDVDFSDVDISKLTTQLEVDMTKFGKQAEEWKKLEVEDTNRVTEKSLDILYGKERTGDFLLNGRQASLEALDDFFINKLGSSISREEQQALLEAIEFRSKTNLVSRDTFRERINDLFTSGKVDFDAKGVTRTPRQLVEAFDNLSGRLDDIEDATFLGLQPYASRQNIIKRGIQVEKELGEAWSEIINNPARQKLLESAAETLDSVVKNRALGVSQEFIESANFLKFISANAMFNRADNIALRTGEIDQIIKNMEKNADKFRERLADSTKKAIAQDYIGKNQADRLASMVSGAAPIKPEEFTKMRVPLAKYILRELETSIVPELIDKDLGAQLKDVRQRLAELPDKINNPVELRSAISKEKAQEQAIKSQLSQTFFQSPRIARALALDTGNQNLVRALDYYFASLGDEVSRINIAAEQYLSHRQVPLDIALNRIKNRPTPSIDLEDTIAPNKKSFAEPEPIGTDKGLKETRQEQLDRFTSTKDLGTIERNIGTPEAIASTYERRATTETMRSVYGNVKNYFKEAFVRRNKILEDLEDFEFGVFNKFTSHIEALGESGKLISLRFIEDVSEMANSLIKEGVDTNSIEEVIAKKVAAQGEDVRTSYKLFRDSAEWIREKGNEGIRRLNAKIDSGELSGKKLPEIPRRPGWMYYTYEGDYILKLVEPDGYKRTIDYVYGREAAVRSIKDYFEKHGDVRGMFVLEPKFIDDASGLIRMGNLGKNLDKAFGIDAIELKRAVDDGSFKTETVHDVFYGSTKERKLNLEDKKVGVLQSTMLNAMASIRYSNYVDLMFEGRSLAKTLKDYNLPRWSNYVKVYSEDLLGMSRNVEKALDDHLQGVIDLVFDKNPVTRDLLSSIGMTPSSRLVRNVSSMMTFLGRTTTLGLNAGTALVNPLLFASNVWPVIGTESTLFAMKNLAAAWKTPEFKALLRKGGVTLRQSGIGMREELTRPDIILSRGAQAYKKIDELSMWMFNTTENLTRGATLLGAKKQAESMAKSISRGIEPRTWQEKELASIAKGRGLKVTNPEVWDEYAVHVLKQTNFDYDLAGLSELARSPVTKPFMQFKSFTIKQLEFLMGRSLPITNKERIMSIGVVLAVGGLFAMPGVEDIDNVSRLLFGGISPKLFADAYLPEIITSGGTAALGIDMSGKVGLGSVAFLTNLDTFPFGVGAHKVGNIARAIKGGRLDTMDALLSTNSALHSLSKSFELMNTGKITDTYGQELVGKEDVNPFSMIARIMGIPTMTESKVSRARTYIREINERQTARNRKALRQINNLRSQGRYGEARELQKQEGITERQLKADRKKREMSTSELLRRQTSTINRDRPEVKQALEGLE